MKIAICTLGCKVNQYETQAMETELKKRGHILCSFDDFADIYIINTCTVTATSDHKSRQMIRQARKRNQNALVAVCGCYAQTDPQAVAALGVDLVGGASGRMAFLDDLERLANEKVMSTSGQGLYNSPSALKEKNCFFEKNSEKGSAFENRPEALVTTGNIMSTRAFEELPAGGLEGRTRAMLKVEDGCVNFCSYCIIPYARGPVRSLPAQRAAAEAKRLMDEGYKELVVTGIEISSWGQDLPGKPPLAELVEAICEAAPRCRIRLGSLEPRTVTEDFCRRVIGLHNLCPHFHLSLQSGCDETLKRMNRKYDTARFYQSVELLRRYYDKPGITTDLIVGFPGETEEELEKTLAFLQKCGFSAMHIFPYSRRQGTPADKMPGQVPKAEKEERSRRTAAVAAQMQQAYQESWLGQSLSVLFEEEVPGQPGLWRGHAPNYVEVYAPGDGLHNIEMTVKITDVDGDHLMGELT